MPTLPIPPNTGSFITTFNLINDVPTIKLQDIYPYEELGIDLIDVVGLLKVVDPLGNTFYNNTDINNPDIESNISRIFTTVLPSDINDVPLNGNYTFTYTIIVSGLVLPGTYTSVKNYSFCYEDYVKETEVKENIDCLCGELSSTDATNYGTLGTPLAIPILDILDSNNILLKGDETGIFGIEGSKVSIIENPLIAGEYTVVGAELDVDDNTVLTVLETIADLTVEGLVSYPNLMRKHIVSYPRGTNLPEIRSILQTVKVSPIYTNTWTTCITSILYYTQGDGLNVITAAEGCKEYVVNCDWDLCDIFACIDKLLQRWSRALSRNPGEAKRIKEEQLDIVVANMVLFRSAQECGQTKRASEILDLILRIGDCEKGCGCDGDDGKPKRIVPICSAASGNGGSTIVTTSGNGINIVSTVDNDTTIYQLSLDPSLISKINNAARTFLTAGNNVSIATVVNPDGSRTYTVNAVVPPVPNRKEFILSIFFDATNGIASFDIDSEFSSGANIRTTPVVVQSAFASVNNEFTIKDFQVTPNFDHKATMAELSGVPEIALKLKNSTVAGEVKFSFLKDGLQVSSIALAGRTIKINIKISE